MIGATRLELSLSGSERDVRVGGRRVGHILDPATGEPAAFAGSVTVWRERALVADILSTALYVKGPERGLAWADARDVAAAITAGTSHTCALLDDGEVKCWGTLTSGAIVLVLGMVICAQGGIGRVAAAGQWAMRATRSR